MGEFKDINKVTDGELLEMSKISFKKSGIDNVVIWIGPSPKTHGYRVKVSNIPDKFGSDCFVVTIPDYEIVGRCELDNKTLDKVILFLKKNQQAIIEHCKGESFSDEMVDKLKKWDSE